MLARPSDTLAAAALPRPEHDGLVEGERHIREVLGQARRAAAVNLLLGAGVTAVFQDEVSPVRLLGWYLVLAMVCALRGYTASECLARPAARSAWLPTHRLSVVATALLWGMATYWLGRDAAYVHNVFLTFVLAGNASAAIPTMAPMPMLYRTYLVCAATPVLIDFLSRDGTLYQVMAFMIALCCVTLDTTGRSYHRALSAALSLDDTNAKLVDELRRNNAMLRREIGQRRQSEQRFRGVFDDAPIGLALCAADDRIVDVNQALCRLSGYRMQELVGMCSATLLPAGSTDDDADGRIDDDTLTAFPDVRRLQTPRGDTRWVTVSSTRLHCEPGAEARTLVQIQDITRAFELSRLLRHQARHDDLTGLLNRREFETRVSKALRVAEKEPVEHALAYLDLDLFKVVNDTCGHAAGDQLLRTVAGIVRRLIRHSDCLARVGGDEFLLLMERCTVEQAERITSTIRAALDDLVFPWGDKRFKVTVSIGLVPITGAGETVGEILSAADAACFLAKEQGRNRVHASRRSDAELRNRQSEMDWVARINEGLQHGRFELMFQAIEPSIPRATAGRRFELLVRLRGDDGRLFGPGAFLPAAERYHVITGIDRWVVGTACAWLTGLGARIECVASCAINLSGQSFTNNGFLAFTLERMRALGEHASRVCFEITETTAITNLADAQSFMSALKALGCRFALDDFGSGLSSFGYLKALPVDYLKIDGQFVKDIADDPVNRAMVRSMHEIGKLLGKQTIAEFVENDRIRACLGDIGVDFVQGYGIAVPRPLGELLEDPWQS